MIDRWFASSSVHASMVAHRLALTEELASHWDPKSWPTVSSLCGQERRRRTWQPLDDFVRPEAFERCSACTALTGAGG